MNVGELRTALKGLDPALPVILQKDAEGNGYSPLDGADIATYVAESTWSGEVYDDDDPDRPTDEGERAVILWPVN